MSRGNNMNGLANESRCAASNGNNAKSPPFPFRKDGDDVNPGKSELLGAERELIDAIALVDVIAEVDDAIAG